MKKQHIRTAFALTLLILTACTGRQSPSSTAGHEETTATMTNIPVSRDFTQVNNMSNIDITWNEGPCSIRFEGNPLLQNAFDISIDDAGLTVNELDAIDDDLQAHLYISSPTLTILSNYNGATIRLAGTLHAERLEIGNVLNGRIEADTLVCQTLKYSALNDAKASFALIRADEADLIADGNGSTDVTLDVRHLILNAWGTQTVTLSGHADTKDIQSSRTNMVNDLLQ